MGRILRTIVGSALLIVAVSWDIFHPSPFARAEANSNSKALIVPYVMREDFQGEGLGQFASYPPAQDIGYEPSLSPTSDFGAPGGRALMRIVKPNRPGTQRFGFIKKVRLTAGRDSRLRFAYRLNSSTAVGTLEIGLAGAHGRLYETKLTPKLNEWSVADVSLGEIRGLEAGIGIEAVYIVADLRETDADITYRFMIDDITITAQREARFDVRVPKAEFIEPWPTLISAKSYRAGQSIILEASAPVRMARVDCVLETQDGRTIQSERLYDDGSHGDRIAGDGIWSNNAVYSPRASDPSGLWLAQLRGNTDDGRQVKTSVRLIVRPPGATTHPKLFFDAAERPQLIERSRDPKLSKLWTYLQTTAKSTRASGDLAHGGKVFELLDSEYLLPSLLAYFDVLNRARSRIAHNSLEAYITGNEEARTAAKAAMLDVAQWQHWEPPWFRAHGQHTYYPAGLLAADVALGYDLLYDAFSETERGVIRRALIEKSIIPTFKEYVADNRVMTNTSNWLAHTVGGALIAAASIANDVTETESNGLFETHVGGLLLKLEDHIKASYLADGSYGEGISYHEFDAETLGPALVALQRAFGTDYWKHSHVLDSLAYSIYTMAQPLSASLDMGDTHPPAGHGIPALVYKSKDPTVRWYYSQFDRPSLSKFIFYDNSVEPRVPTLPTSRIFWDKGNAVFRSGWGSDDVVFLYRAGPNFNHHHADQGAFLLTAYGENLVSEAGWSDYYKDPHYVTYFTQAIGHSTVLVDGNPESQSIADTPQFAALNNYPRITDAVTSSFYDSVTSELASVYQGRLERFTRRIVFVKPHYFVIFDDLKVKGAPARLNWLLHIPNQTALETSEDLVLYLGKKAALALRTFAPDRSEIKMKPGRVPYHEFAARTPAAVPAAPAYIDLSTGPVSATNFLTALVPARSAEEAKSLAGNMSEIKDQFWLGIRISRPNETDLVMFRVAGQNGQALYREWLTDAASWTATKSKERLTMVSAHSVKNVSFSGWTIFSSDKPTSFAMQLKTEAVVATLSLAQGTQVRFATGTPPARVLLDGQELPTNAISFKAAGQTTQISVPAGRHEIVFALR
jgi:hypothetical protein